MNPDAENELLDRADTLKRQADAVLEKSAIRTMLSRIGHPEIVGSYALGLLVRPDIDIIVTSGAPARAAAVDVTKRILDAGYFQSVVFIDHYTFNKRLDAEMDARKFYWHLDAPEFDFGQQWKLDIWYLAPDQNWFQDRTDFFRDLLAAQPDARRTILRLKHHFLEDKAYTHGLKGGLICEAVLERGLQTPQELLRFAEERQSRNTTDAGERPNTPDTRETDNVHRKPAGP